VLSSAKLVATICGDDQIRVWDIEKGDLYNSIKSSSGIITTFESEYLGTKNGSVERWYITHEYSKSIQKLSNPMFRL
jgi:hypothetical protein